MPEGPEIKTVAHSLSESLSGKTLGVLWHSPARLRLAPDYSAMTKLMGQVISRVECYGKVLFIHSQEQVALVAQLGMTGQLKVCPINSPLEKHTHIRWQLKAAQQETRPSQELRYVDPRRFGLLDICDQTKKEQIIARLGPDPFSMSIKDFPELISRMSKSSRAIKEILLDQSVIAGVGNIYASEALFKARIQPERAGADLSHADYERLLPAQIAVMHEAYKNRGTSFSNYVDGDGQQGNNKAFLQVFQRESQACPICQTSIRRIKQGGRSTFYCPQCQN